ncbi:MAG: cytochrome c [Elusimicrobia bacterium]|nr:cytochrome c [Elusimicrobiota bacterium]
MRTLKFAWLAALAALAACQKPVSDPSVRGERYFNALGCAQCHQVGDKGGIYGPNLTFVGFRKNPQWLDLWLKDPHSWRKETVMPNFNLTEEARTALVAYLSAQKGQAWTPESRPWNHPTVGDSVKRGELLFDKAGCVACHAQKGRGGYPNNNVMGGQIPSLSRVFETYTKDELIKRISGGVIPESADPSQPPPMIQMPKWGDVLSPAELSLVADYLLSLGGSAGNKSDW